MKKIPLLMSILLCTQLFGTAAFATTGVFSDVPADASYAQAVETLAQDGIITGDDKGNFNPDSTITRAEAATIICRLTGVETEAKKLSNSGFIDVPSSHWAAGYVAEAVKLGIVNGYGNGYFGPSDPVTYEQMVKMLVCTLGYESVAKSYGGYPDGYLHVSNSLQINTSEVSNTKENARRSTVAVLVFKAQQAPIYDSGDVNE